MEGKPVPTLIPVRQISSDFPFSFRFDYRDPELEASLEKRGILFPLLLVPSQGSNCLLVSGHKRFLYAKRRGWSGVPGWILEGLSSPKECFLLSLLANWNQHFSELDRMAALQRSQDVFGFSEEEVQRELLPLLGLAAGRSVLREYREVACLVPQIHRLLFEKRLPFLGASSLRRFSGEEQRLLAEAVFSGLHLTTNQLRLVAEWLFDLKKMLRTSLREVLEDEAIQQILRHPRLNARLRGEKLVDRVRSFRFPRLTEGGNRSRRFREAFTEEQGGDQG